MPEMRVHQDNRRTMKKIIDSFGALSRVFEKTKNPHRN